MVVDRVIRATGELLGEVGYAALRIEDVAVRSGVNKTTIYRRWPTRAELVAATMRKLKVPADRPRAERLRDEVLDYTREIFAFHASPEGRGMVRVIQLEQSHPELEPLVRELRAETRRARTKMVERAISRGELPPGTDATLVSDMIFAPVMVRLFTLAEPADERVVAEVVDIVMTGVAARARLTS